MRHSVATTVSASLALLLIGVAFVGGAAAQERLGQVPVQGVLHRRGADELQRAMALYHSFAWKAAGPAFTEIT